MKKRICVFCGAGSGNNPVYEMMARDFARMLVENDYGLVYGGASVGLMGVVADTVLAMGGEAIGIIPRKLIAMEVAHQHLTEMVVVETMHERKEKMIRLSDAFVSLPGGQGTMDELFEVTTLAQLSYHDHPSCVYSFRNYYSGLDLQLKHMVQEGFLSETERIKLFISNDLSDIFNFLQNKLQGVSGKCVALPFC